jgi:predicted amidohydrolase YtcJ
MPSQPARAAMKDPQLTPQNSAPESVADLIVRNAKVTTLQDNRPEAQAFAVRGEKIVAVGDDVEVMHLRGDGTRVIDADRRRVIPGLNDSHLHAVRGALFYNLELRWDGVRSLQRGLEMIRKQAKRTPNGQWVRVIGGWSPYQFVEKRWPTAVELNDAAPDTPVFILFAYSQVLLNKAAVAVLTLAPASEPLEGGSYEFVDGGGLIVQGTAAVYATIARLPTLSEAGDQLNSTRHFFQELNRFGMTSTVDAGATGVDYPKDYDAVGTMAAWPKFPIRISNFLFAQKPGTEMESFKKWTAMNERGVNHAVSRLNGFVLEGGGEILVWDASDFENFMAPRPELKPQVDEELTAVADLLARTHWPIRIHATYDETITRILNVFERVFKETGYKSRWAIDHAETIKPRNIARIKAMGGGIAVQNRLAFAGEYFVERYGKEAAASVQPLRAIVDAGIPVGAGTDATRVSSYNPWLSLYWMVTGKTVGGMQLASPKSRLSREEALRLYTVGSAWFSGEEGVKGRIAPGQFAVFAILSADYLSVADEQINTIESVLTVTGGDIVYTAAPFAKFAPEPLPPVSPVWSPVAVFGGFQQAGRESPYA